MLRVLSDEPRIRPVPGFVIRAELRQNSLFDRRRPCPYDALTMDPRGASAVERLVTRVGDDPQVLAVLLFGSRARGDASSKSDVAVCLVLAADPWSDLAAAHKRLDYLAGGELDLVLFHQLPLHIRSRILKEGVVLFTRDEDALYALAIRTARAFEGFRHIHREYLEQVARD